MNQNYLSYVQKDKEESWDREEI